MHQNLRPLPAMVLVEIIQFEVNIYRSFHIRGDRQRHVANCSITARLQAAQHIIWLQNACKIVRAQFLKENAET